jgi:hypothetical protein
MVREPFKGVFLPKPLKGDLGDFIDSFLAIK